MSSALEQLINAKKDVVSILHKMLLEKKVNIANAIDLISITMVEVGKFNKISMDDKKMLACDIIQEFAKGADGIEGTKDDLLPKVVVKGIQSMIEHDLITSTINVIVDASKGRLTVDKVQGCFMSYFACLSVGTEAPAI
jgi:hypothetical protein